MSYTDVKAIIDADLTKHSFDFVGIDSNLRVSIGFDSICEEAKADTSELQEYVESLPPGESDHLPFTKEQKHVLADRMIALWNAYKLAAN